MGQEKEKKGGVLELTGQKARKQAIDKLADRLDLSKDVLISTLKSTAFVTCKEDAQFMAAVVVANTYGLNPILKEMTAFPGKGGGVVPVVMIDGWIKLVSRREDYDGVALIENEDKEGKKNKSGTTLDSVTATFYLKTRSHPVVVTEYMEECYDSTKEPWKRWPRRMLRHKAYIQGARVAFGFSGIYDEDEKDRIIAAEEAAEIKEPVIGLKNDRNKPGDREAGPGQITDAEIKDVDGQQEDSKFKTLDWLNCGSVARFGKTDEKKAAFMIQNIEKCAPKLGKEETLNILGSQGWTVIAEMSKLADLVKFTNAVLEAVKIQEAR